VLFRKINPIIPAINEEIKIMILELSICSPSEKARSVINIDIVKPIPPRKLTPNMDFQFKSVGSSLILNFTER
jgi:hypothetical protein